MRPGWIVGMVAIAAALLFLIIANRAGLIPDCGAMTLAARDAQRASAFPYCMAWHHPGEHRFGPYLEPL